MVPARNLFGALLLLGVALAADALSLEKDNETLSFGPIILQSRTTPKALTNTTINRPENNAHPTLFPSETPPLPDTTLIDLGIMNSSLEDNVLTRTPLTVLNEPFSNTKEVMGSTSDVDFPSSHSSPAMVYDSVTQRETTDVAHLVLWSASSPLEINGNILTTFVDQGTTSVKSMPLTPNETVLPLSFHTLLNHASTPELLAQYSSAEKTLAVMESIHSSELLPFEESTQLLPLGMLSSDALSTRSTVVQVSGIYSEAYTGTIVDSTFLTMFDSSSFSVTEEPTKGVSLSGTDAVFFSTSLPFLSSTVLSSEDLVSPNHLFTSSVVLEITRSTTPHLPDSSDMSSQMDILTEFASPVPSVRPRTSCAHCDYTLVPSPLVLSTEYMQNLWSSEDYPEVLTFTAFLAGSFTLPTNLFTNMHGPEESSLDVYNTAFSSIHLVGYSTRFMEDLEATTGFSSMNDANLFSSIPTTLAPDDSQSPLETQINLMTVNVSLPDTESYYLAPSLTAQLSLGIFSIDLPSPFETSTNMSVSREAFGQTSLLEAPAFKHTQSVLDSGTLSTSISVDETFEASGLVLSLISTWYTFETSSLSSPAYDPSYYSLLQSMSSSLWPQELATVLNPSELFANHSSVTSSGIAGIPSSMVDLSLVTPWQTSHFEFPVSDIPSTSAFEDWPTSDFYFGTSVVSEVLNTPETLLSLTSYEATSSLETSLLQTLFFSFPETSTTLLFPASNPPFISSTVSIHEEILASSFDQFPPTPTLTPSLPILSSFQASSIGSEFEINPSIYSSHFPQTVTGIIPLESSVNEQLVSSVDVDIVPSLTRSIDASKSVVIMPTTPTFSPTPLSPSSSLPTPATLSSIQIPLSSIQIPLSSSQISLSSSQISLLSTPGPLLSTPGPLLSTPGPLLSTPGSVSSTTGSVLSTPSSVSTSAPLSSTSAPLSSTSAPLSSTPAPLSSTPTLLSSTPVASFPTPTTLETSSSKATSPPASSTISAPESKTSTEITTSKTGITEKTTDTTPTTAQSTTRILGTTGRTTLVPTSKISAASTTTPAIIVPPTVPATRQPLVCDINATDAYLVTAVLSRSVVMETIKRSIELLLSVEFRRSVELEMYSISPAFTFLVISGPFVYTAIAVTNAIRGSNLYCEKDPVILSIQPSLTAPDSKYQVQTVLQFVPLNMEIGFCNFTQRLERGLALAFAEVRRLRQETDDFTIQILNVTVGPTRTVLRKGPVNIVFAVRDGVDFLNGSDVSNLLRNLSTVEFSFYLGFPVQQLAEPSYYPQLNISQLLKDSWLKTVLLGVDENKIQEEVFPAEMERKLAQLINEALSQGRRWKRATNAGSNTVQIVNVSRLEGSDNPAALIYFVEDVYGERLSAAKAADLINVLNIQRAAIILGYRVQGVLAQPVNMVQEAPKDSQNLLIIVGVAVPVTLVMIILVILYWKLCRTDKLEFQPDTMSNIQQRQKLQAPCVKGFDFAKQHLGQHSKDDVLIIHEPAPLPMPVKDTTHSENGDVPTPKSKTSSKPSKAVRRRGRVTPSDAGSTASDQSSGKDSAEETVRVPVPPEEIKPHKAAKGAPQASNGNEQHSSAAMFEHVDRVSHSSDLSRRFPSKIQLIAMQPIPARPMHSFVLSDRVAETNKINKEIQTALRHKSEIEHHRNKIRLRAKRKGHYEFPVVDLMGLTDTRERHKMYRKAQMQIDKILDPGGNGPQVFMETRKSSRSKRSPKQRRRHQINGSPPDAEKDRLITTDSDGTYKRPPGVSNSAYISDADLVIEPPTPSSCTDLGKFPGSSLHAPLPAQYLPPQPSIAEARQTMHSLLDDAFALVAPTSQTAVQTVPSLPGTIMGQPVTSPPIRTERDNTHWGSCYTQAPDTRAPFARYVEYGVATPSAPSLTTRAGYGQGYISSAEQAQLDRQHQEHSEMKYASRALYPEEIPSVARPRPIGGTSGPSQIQHLTQVGIASRLGAQVTDLQVGRPGQIHPAVPSWSSHHAEEDFPHSRDKSQVLGHQEYPPSPMYHMQRTSGRQPSAPPAHLQHNSHPGPGLYYPGGSMEDLQPGHTSASLIKAIREELLRLSQKQTAVQNFHS
ncbi:UPF0606 protein KIAA1549 homolog isoform X2 [Ambystoma mexicanum]|uniref:UPF0606 protein KIAA1549 homolog isoform X2 n=1 Tax=Ambystoma mexicanum TaxID=8296 RepID=UPI0037E95EEE